MLVVACSSPVNESSTATTIIPKTIPAPTTTTAPINTSTSSTPITTTTLKQAPTFEGSIEGVDIDRLGHSWHPGCRSIQRISTL